MSEVDKRHGDPEHGGLTSGEKAAISHAVHEGREVKFTAKHPEHAAAAEEYRKEVESKMGLGKGDMPAEGEAPRAHVVHHKAHAPEEHHGAGELSGGEKSAVARAVHSGKDVSELPFTQGHPRKLERAKEYAEEVKTKGIPPEVKGRC